MRKATVIKYHDSRGRGSVDITVPAILSYLWFRNLWRYPRFEDAHLVNIAEREEDIVLYLVLYRQAIRDRVAREQRKYKRRFDKKRYENVEYEVEDVVAVRRLPVADGSPTKLQSKYKGPYVIIEVRIERLVKEGGYSSTSHVTQLNIYRNHDEDIEYITDEIYEYKIEEEESDIEENIETSVVEVQNENNSQFNERQIRMPKKFEDFVFE